MVAILPQAVLPYVSSGVGPHFRVVLSTPAVTLNITLLAGSYYNDGRTGTAGNLLKALIDGLNAAEVAAGSGGTWNNSADSGQRIYLLQRDGGATDDATNIQFPSSELPADALGFAGTTTPTSDAAGVTKWQATRGAGRCWIPRPTSQCATFYDDVRAKSVVVTTEGMGGDVGSRDRWGTRSRMLVEIARVPAAAVFQHYTDDAEYASAAGAVTGELHFALEALASAWLTLGADYPVRWSPDYVTPEIYREVQAGKDDKWIGDLDLAVQEEQRAPLWFTLVLTCNVVG